MTSSEIRQNGARPLTVDEIVARDNIAGEGEIPADVRAALTTRSVHINAPVNELRQALRPHALGDDITTLTLPASAYLGLAGRTGERVEAGSLATTEDQAEGAAVKPAWAPLVYHPKLSARPISRPLHRPDGTRITPVANQSFIYGADDRAVFYPSGYPWHCLGRVDVYPNATSDTPTEWGSGVLIGDRLVLTAGHIPPVNPQPGQWKMLFTAGLYDGSSTEGAGAVSYVSDFRGYLGGVSSRDYAVLRLYDPLGSNLGYFGWKTYDSSWNNGAYWWLAGYPFDIANAQRPSYQNGIPVLGDPADSNGLELEHHGDIASGDSGGPFWGFWDDGFPYVVGTTSGHDPNVDDNIEAGGNELSNLLGWARSTWPL
jgi:V8-like Glu-specific endopeptidase